MCVHGCVWGSVLCALLAYRSGGRGAWAVVWEGGVTHAWPISRGGGGPGLWFGAVVICPGCPRTLVRHPTCKPPPLTPHLSPCNPHMTHSSSLALPHAPLSSTSAAAAAASQVVPLPYEVYGRDQVTAAIKSWGQTDTIGKKLINIDGRGGGSQARVEGGGVAGVGREAGGPGRRAGQAGQAGKQAGRQGMAGRAWARWPSASMRPYFTPTPRPVLPCPPPRRVERPPACPQRVHQALRPPGPQLHHYRRPGWLWRGPAGVAV